MKLTRLPAFRQAMVHHAEAKILAKAASRTAANQRFGRDRSPIGRSNAASGVVGGRAVGRTKPAGAFPPVVAGRTGPSAEVTATVASARAEAAAAKAEVVVAKAEVVAVKSEAAAAVAAAGGRAAADAKRALLAEAELERTRELATRLGRTVNEQLSTIAAFEAAAAAAAAAAAPLDELAGTVGVMELQREAQEEEARQLLRQEMEEEAQLLREEKDVEVRQLRLQLRAQQQNAARDQPSGRDWRSAPRQTPPPQAAARPVWAADRGQAEEGPQSLLRRAVPRAHPCASSAPSQERRTGGGGGGGVGTALSASASEPTLVGGRDFEAVAGSHMHRWPSGQPRRRRGSSAGGGGKMAKIYRLPRAASPVERPAIHYESCFACRSSSDGSFPEAHYRNRAGRLGRRDG